MNTAEKKHLLGTLSLALPEVAPVKTKLQPMQTGLIVAMCALSAWLFVQLTDSESNLVEAVPSIDVEVRKPSLAPRLLLPTVDEKPVSIVLQATGYITARQTATVSARTTAVVDAVYVVEGDSVKEGMLLARLDDRLKRAEHELAISKHAGIKIRVAEVETELAAARRREARVRTLADSQLASTAELDEVETRVAMLMARLATIQSDVRIAREQVRVYEIALEDFLIRAPFDGVVTERSAQPGEIVSPVSAGGGFTRTGIATLVDMDSLEIEVEVNETHISKVRTEHQVKVTLTAYPDVTYSGKVIAIIPKGDRSKGTVKVRIMLVDGDKHVLPEMGARVDFLTA